MKKLYSIFMMAVMAIAVSFTAIADIAVTLKVDDATRLTAYYQYYDASYNTQQTDLDLNQFTGEEGGTFTIPGDYGYVYVNATSGNVITYAMNETTGSSASTGGSSTYFYVGSYSGTAQTLSVKSADLEASRTASVTVNVDDASKVNMSYYNGTKVELVNGENTVKFNPETESQFQISHVNYGETLYSVKLNDETQADSYGRYYVTVANGDKLDIAANFPAIPATITFSYGDNEEEVLGCITVKVNGEDVTFDGKTLSVMMGDKVTLIGDTNLYNFNYAITVNGTSQYFYGNYEFIVTSETNTVEVAATKYVTYNAYLTVDAPENIEAYPGNSNTPLSLIAGEAVAVELTSNSNTITVRPTTDCSIVSIQVNGVECGSVNGYGTSSTTIRNINENDQIVITTKVIVRDKVATIWVDDLTAAPYGYGVQRYSDRASVSLISGETVTVNFDDSDNPYNISFYGPTYCSIFNNGIYLVPQYEGSTSYYVTLLDGDAIKVYLASEPEKYAVTITESAGVENSIESVATDGQDYAAWAAGFTALKDTEITIALAESAEVSVLVNGSAIDADEEGNYTITVTAETNIVLDKTNAIEDITINTVENNNVYNLQGILVVKNASTEQISDLPAGLYIINGKKVVLK